MEDVTAEMIPLALNREREDARAQRTKSAVYAVCPSIYADIRRILE